MIHFEKSRNASKDKVQLPNGTILEPKNSVKWLGVWLDRKLNYKKQVETRIASANRSFFAIQNMMKSEWGLKPTACGQLNLSCINPISDYGSEIWYNGQKKFNCQKFGHNHYQCKSQAKCSICAQNHETRNHECTICKSTIACAHIVVKCANFNKNHQCNDGNCEMVISLNVLKSTDELAAL